MSFFVDANVLVYSVTKGPARPSCLQILEAIARGRAGGRTSTACLEEVWHLEFDGRAGNLDGLTQHAFAILTPLLPVTDAVFAKALSMQAPWLGTNDRLHVATSIENGISIICSADAAFDQVAGIRRVDPFDPKAVEQLLTTQAS